MRLMNKGRQTGAVLITVLVILTVLTILGLPAIQNATLEERMAGNYRDARMAFEAAEAALRAGEEMLNDDAVFDTLQWDGTDGSYEGAPSLDPLEYESGTDNYTLDYYSVTQSTLTAEPALKSQPVLYLERLSEFPLPKSSLVTGFQQQPPNIRFYRVTARGTGFTDRSEVVLQSSYFR